MDNGIFLQAIHGPEIELINASDIVQLLQITLDLLKERGFQNVTIEVDEDLATHRAHKRNIEELEASQSHGHDHS